MHKKLVLASQSPRRRELVTFLGIPFGVESPTSNEVLDTSLTIDQQIEDLAQRKARSVFEQSKDNIVLGSDTVVVLDGKILGKPKDEEDAYNMLRSLSGRTHEVITGVALISNNLERVFSVKATVKFFELNDEEIKSYVATKDPMDKAGSYSIQGHAALFVESIIGDYYTIMGLPISRVYQELKNGKW